MENVIRPEKTALVLIDLQNDVAKGQELPYSEMGRVAQEIGVIPNTVKMIARARGFRIPVIYVKVERRPDGADVVPVITDQALQGQAQHRQVTILQEGTWGAQIVDEIAPQPGDYIIVKRRVGAFYGTSLEIFLRARGIDTILIGGIATNMGVENTVREGRDRDFNMVVLRDCCAASPREVHDYAVERIFPRLARVMTTDQAISLIEEQLAQEGV